MKIIAGNWKMNGSVAELDSMISVLNEIDTENNVIICVPFTMLNCKKSDRISIGAQDVSTHEHGAYTGEVSAKMIAESGAKYVIVGHSERRQYHNETNDIVNQKALRVLESGLMPIVCVGETLDQKNAGQTFSVIENQVTESTKGLENYILAYEPVWAIGTGLTATTQEIADVHEYIRKLTSANLLYGGSVKGANSGEIMSILNVDGVLVGGASLKPEDFLPIIKSV